MISERKLQLDALRRAFYLQAFVEHRSCSDRRRRQRKGRRFSWRSSQPSWQALRPRHWRKPCKHRLTRQKLLTGSAETSKPYPGKQGGSLWLGPVHGFESAFTV
jgi:hypothetical protein